jgi:hypothetical protein
MGGRMIELPMVPFEWNEEFRKIQQWAEQFINEEMAETISAKTFDKHNIIKRLDKSEIPEWINEVIGSNINYVQLFSAEKNSMGFLHKDGVDRKCAFNVPLSGADEGYIEWYSGIDKERLFEDDFTKIRLLNFDANREKLQILFRSKTSVPCLLNTDIWHRVNNQNNKNWRHVLSFRFEDNPTFESMKTQLLTVKKLRRLVPHNPHH